MPVIKSNIEEFFAGKNSVLIGAGWDMGYAVHNQKREAKLLSEAICTIGGLPKGSLQIPLKEITADMDDVDKLDVYIENNALLESLDKVRCTLMFSESQRARNEHLLKELKELDETNDRFLQEIIRLKQILQLHGIPYTAEDKRVEAAVKEKETTITISVDVQKAMKELAEKIKQFGLFVIPP